MNKTHKTPLLLRMVRWVYPKMEILAPRFAHMYFIRLFFSPFHYAIPVKESKAETFSQKFIIEACGKKIQCYSWGSGDKILLVVHGWAGRATQFRRFIKPFNAIGYRVIGFDGPAHGNSEGKQTSLLEFEETLKKLYDKIGVPQAIIAHSFGGGAVLFAVMNGLPLTKLINISTPVIGDQIINTYLKAINGSLQTKEFFKDYIMRTFNKPFDEFTAYYFIKNLPQKINLLMIHDEDDHEVSIENPMALLAVYPEAKLYKTKGLGHTRILKSDEVIQYCVTYITA